LAAGSLTGGETLLIDLATREPIGEPLDVNVTSLGFSGDSTLMATTSARGVTKVLDTSTGRQVGPDLKSAPGQRAGVAFDAQGDTVFVAGQNGDIIVHGVSGGTKIAKPLGIPGWLVYPSRDTEFVAIPSVPTDDEVRIVEVATGDVVHTLRPEKPYVNYPLAGVLPAAFSPDGQQVAIGSEATTGSPATIEVFDLETGSSRSLGVPGELNIGLALRWHPDGTRLAAGTFDRVLVVDAETGERLQSLDVEIHLPTNLAYDARGRLLVAGLSTETIVFDEEGERLATYGEPGAPQNGSWAPDGSLVLTNSISGEITIVDAETGESVAPSFTAGSPLTAQVGANGIGVATTWNNIVTLWDVSTGQQIGEPFNPSDATVHSTVVDASGTHLVSGGTNSVVWDIDPAVWRARACEAAGRNLTQEEWDEFLPDGEPYHVTCPQYTSGL
jgi:WD40 repeat protein